MNDAGRASRGPAFRRGIRFRRTHAWRHQDASPTCDSSSRNDRHRSVVCTARADAACSISMSAFALPRMSALRRDRRSHARRPGGSSGVVRIATSCGRDRAGRHVAGDRARGDSGAYAGARAFCDCRCWRHAVHAVPPGQTDIAHRTVERRRNRHCARREERQDGLGTPLSSEPFDFTQGPGPHSTPLVIGDRLFATGTNKQVHALDTRTGKVIGAGSREGSRRAAAAHQAGGEGRVCREPARVSRHHHPAGRRAGQAVIALRQSDGSVAWKSGDFLVRRPRRS